MLKSLHIVCVAGLVAATSPALAPAVEAGGGGPPPADQALGPVPSESSILSPTGATRYVTATVDRHTAVIAQNARTGAVRGAVLLRGFFAVETVDEDWTPVGLSADGATLVLIGHRDDSPKADTALAVIDTKPRGSAGLRLRRTVRLNGDFSIDALSPAGHSLFLTQFTSRGDPSSSRVRVYDVRKGRLDRQPIVGPGGSAGEMSGYPLSRAASPDGRWAYTLYEGIDMRPFIHALDTVERRVVRIDLRGRGLAENQYELHLDVSPDGRSMNLLRKRRPIATVDTRTFRGSKPAVASTAARDEGPHPALARDEAPRPSLGPIALVTCVLAAVAFLLRRRTRRSGAAPAPDRPPPVEEEDDRPAESAVERLTRR